MADEQILAVLTELRTEMMNRFDQVDARFGLVDGRLGSIDTRLGAVETRMDSLETQVRDLRNDTLSHFDELYQRLDFLRTEYYALDAAASTSSKRTFEALALV